MNPQKPHYLLFSQSISGEDDQTGHWHFVLEALDGGPSLEASDEELRVEGERLELLAVVRGLEALDQPSSVTLVTSSQQIARGFRNGLEQWRSNHWKWERFGRYVPVKNKDLWQRIDHALKFHRVECRTWRFDPPHTERVAKPATIDRPVGRPNPLVARVRNAVGNLKTWVMGEHDFGTNWARTA
ncbi:RNase H family protein [Planctomycetota bacterium]